MNKVIITGANGFIGKNLVKQLAHKGIKVYAIVKDITSNISEIENIPNIEMVYCNLDDILQLKQKICDQGIDVFYHFAWAGTSGNIRGNYELQLINAKACCNAVKVAHEMGVKKFILAGSIMEYECQKYISQDLAQPGLGNIYSIAKLSAHYMAKTLAYNLGIDFVCATISNIYGVGEVSHRLINTTIIKLIKNEETSFTNGNQLYDFIYIDDAIRAFELIGQDGKPFKTYYIGNKKPQLLKEFLLKIREYINENIELGLGKEPFNGVSLNYTEFSTMGLYEDFDFKPIVNFEDGIKRTEKWLRKVIDGGRE